MVVVLQEFHRLQCKATFSSMNIGLVTNWLVLVPMILAPKSFPVRTFLG